MSETPPEASPRARVAAALGAAVLLAGVIVAVLVLGGSEESGASAASRDCIEAWNEDGLATAYGRHNSVFHDYEDVQVTRLELTGGELVQSDGGECAVIFGAVELDREPIAAGQLLRTETWTPFSLLAGVGLDRVAELQAAAIEGANAGIDEQGKLTGF